MKALATDTARANLGLSLARPILVGGCPRSGTTLLGALLGVGPDVLTVPESGFKWTLLQMALATDDRLDRSDVVARLRADRRFARWAVDPDVLVERVGPATCAQVLDELVAAHGARVGKPRPAVWVDHTPWNTKYAASLACFLPTATFVHVVRDGRAVAASVRELDWGPRSMDAVAHWWAAHVAMGLAAERAWGSGRVFQIRFEDLVRDPAGTLADLRARLVLPPGGVDGAGTPEFVVDAYSRAQHHRVAEPPDPSRIDAWEQVLRPWQVEAFERRTGDLLALLGYAPRYGVHARSPASAIRAFDVLAGTARRQLVDRLRRRRRERQLGPGPGGTA